MQGSFLIQRTDIDKMKTTLSFGELLWDLFPGYKTPGGSPANLAYHLSILGNKSHLLSRVGRDLAGTELIEFVRSKGLDTDHIQIDAVQPTGIVSVHIDEHNEPSYTIHEPSAWDFIELTDPLQTLASTLDAICYASLSQRNIASRDTIQKLIDSVPKQCVKVYDMNLRPPFFNPDEILGDIQNADLVKWNETEFQTVAEWLNVSDPTDHFLSKDPQKMILLTLGEKGSRLITSGNSYNQRAFSIEHGGDFVGVGDAFLGCFVHLLLQKREPEEILEKSSRYAAYVASSKGSMPAIPDELL